MKAHDFETPRLLAPKRHDEDFGLGTIELQLRDLVQGIEPGSPSERGRPRVLPACLLWAGLLVGVLRGMRHQSEVWRLLTLHGLWDHPRVPVGDEAVYKRLAKQDGTMARLFEQISAQLRTRLQPYAEVLVPWASGIYAIDSSTLDKVARTLPALRDATPNECLPGKLHVAFDIRLQQFAAVVREDYAATNDKRLIGKVLPSLPSGALLLFDLGFFSFELFDDLTEQGFFWVTRLRNKTSYKRLHVFYEDKEHGILDALIWLGAYKADRTARALRLVTFRIGQTEYRYLTNVLEPERLSLHQIAGLYQRRWDVELAFLLLKRELSLHFLFSAKTEVIWHQVYAALIIAQIVQAVRVEIAARAGVKVDDVSLNLLVRTAPQLARSGRDLVEVIVTEGRRFGLIRASRRTANRAPLIDVSAYTAPPPDLELTRKPRYAKRRCADDTPDQTQTEASATKAKKIKQKPKTRSHRARN